MKRAFLLAMFLTILLVFFAACDSNDTPAVDTSSAGTDSETTIVAPVETEATATETSAAVTEPTDVTEPETNEPDTVPAETAPVATQPAETEPVETEPVETETDHVHVWSDWQTTKEATCTENGLQERSCACGENETQDIEAIGHTEVIDEAVAPTCTDTGLTEGKHCSACKAVLTAQETVAALGHTPGAEATCTTDQVCTVCGAKLASATGHSFGEWYTTKEPTEAEKGEKRRDCANCDEYETTPIAALAHSHDNWDTITIKAVEPTCTTTGLTEGKKCSGCGEILVDQKVVPATGHTMGSWKQTQAPTCTVAGTEKRECSECDHEETRSVAATGHSHKAVVTAPTCTEKGYTSHTCHCGDSYVDSYVNALGHRFGEWYETKAPTESAQGEKRRDCANCDEYETAPIAALAHSHDNWDTITLKAVAPTCTTTGLTEGKKCSGCGETLVAQEVIPARGHTFNMGGATAGPNGVISSYTECSVCGYREYDEQEDETETESDDGFIEVNCKHKNHEIYSTKYHAPTCESYGYDQVNFCHDCKFYYIPDDHVIPKVDHVYEKVDHVHEDFDNVYNTYKCKTCDASFTEQVAPDCWDESSESGYVLYTCSECGVTHKVETDEPDVPIKYSEGLEFTSKGNGTCYVSGIGTCTDLDVVIPPVSPEGETVISIGLKAFFCCDSLTSVKIPTTVTSIDYYAFFGCAGLTDAYYEGSLEQWCNISFACDTANPCRNGSALYISGELADDIVIPSTVTEIKNYAFNGCTSLTSIEILAGVTTIGEGAFALCKGLTRIEIPDSATSIRDSAFAYCTSLTSIEIPDSVTSIGEGVDAFINSGAFTGCTSLVSVSFGENSQLTTFGIYAFAGCTMLKSVGPVGSGSSVEIPEGVTSIDAQAFSGCTGLTSVTIPDRVTTIGANAFHGCTGLTSIGLVGSGASVEIPASVISIGNRAFTFCKNLTSVKIPASVISIGAGAFEFCRSLTSIEIPDSITSIGHNAFSGCRGLTSIEIPASVITIGGYAFRDCTNLRTLSFGGTVTQWNAIKKYAIWNLNIPATQVICSDGVVPLN